jgi:predicted nucleotidyltransferase
MKIPSQILEKSNQIEKLCDKYKVKNLELFGSATRDDFDANKSDIDFLIEFSENAIENYADNFFGLKSELQILLSSSVDLVVTSSIKNPYFLESIQADRQPLYAA